MERDDEARRHLDEQRARREASDEPTPYAGRANEPGQQLAGHDPSPHTGRAESGDMSVSSAELPTHRLPPSAPPADAADTGLTATGLDEEYEIADPPKHMLTTEEKLGLDHGAPGAIRDP